MRQRCLKWRGRFRVFLISALFAAASPVAAKTPEKPTGFCLGPSCVQTSTTTFWVYHNGVFNWGGDYSSNATIDYHCTTGAPTGGGQDICVTDKGPWALWLPYAGGTVPMWNFDDRPYNNLTFALKPTVANQSWTIIFVLVGDVALPSSCGHNVSSYGPTPVVGQWGVYHIPLADLCVSKTNVYKFLIQDQTGLSTNVWYVDNVAFTP